MSKLYPKSNLIRGFAITFFLTRLDHDGLYVMYEVGHLEFPSSLAQLPVSTNLKNLNILLLVCHVFWKFCKKSDIPSIMQQRRRTSVKLTDLIDLTDPTKGENIHARELQNLEVGAEQ
ncbi:hypothetical protein A0J61_01438 [Choanephora cucurbitarum]|uniref:Uncharacterized protein n=1 Tax=Choanephora cucurbitarum TaxID=101091 RepID=A0A1C7NNP2_9FUNG|nr:hypothetical protein A0J61_01438 [Choanephora cucurbitarum]